MVFDSILFLMGLIEWFLFYFYIVIRVVMLGLSLNKESWCICKLYDVGDKGCLWVFMDSKKEKVDF